MGFYSGRNYSFLTEAEEGLEDGVVVDMDDGYSQDLQKIEDNVEPYNVEDVAAAQVGHPNDDAGFDPVEESWQVIADTQYNWNRIMEATAIDELNAEFNGTVPMTESAEGLKKWFAKVKEFFVNLVKKVANIVKKWISNMGATLSSNKKFMEKYSKNLGEGKSLYSKNKDRKIKGYAFKKELAGDSIGLKSGDEMLTSVKNASGVDINTGDITAKGRAPEADAQSTSANAIRGSVLDAYGFGGGPCSNEEFTKKLDAALYGSESKEKTITEMDVDVITAFLTRDKSIVKKAKDEYKKFEKAMNKVIAGLKKMETKAYKDTGDSAPKGGDRTNKLNNYRVAINLCQTGANAMQLANSKYLAAVRTACHQSRAYANQYVYAYNKAHTKEKNEGLKSQNASALLAGVEFI